MVNLEALRERFAYINGLYREHDATITEVQDEALESLVPELVAELQPPLDQSAALSGVQSYKHVGDRAAAFLADRVTVFRFLRKAHFDPLLARELLRRTLRWRITESLDLASPSSLDPLYTGKPLFYLHPKVQDRFGRPAAIISMQDVVRTEDGRLESLKEAIAFLLEVARRYLADLSVRDEAEAHVQLVLLLDLTSSNLSNFEIELFGYLTNLLKNHFPGESQSTRSLTSSLRRGVWQACLVPYSSSITPGHTVACGR